MTSRLDRVSGNIHISDTDLSCTWLDQGCQHVNGRCLAGPVWSEQAEELPRGDFQVEAVDGSDTAVTFNESGRGNRGRFR